MSVPVPVVTQSEYFSFKEANVFTDKGPKTFVYFLKKWEHDQNTVTRCGTHNINFLKILILLILVWFIYTKSNKFYHCKA